MTSPRLPHRASWLDAWVAARAEPDATAESNAELLREGEEAWRLAFGDAPGSQLAPHPLSDANPDGPGSISCVGQVRLDGKPFVKLEVLREDFAQLAPRDAMNMGTRFIMAAIEAERDAGMVRGMLDEGRTREEIGALLTIIRKYRDSADPDPDASITHPRFPT